MDELFSFAYVEYYQIPKQQKQIQTDQDEQEINQKVINSIIQSGKKIKSKYLEFSADPLVDRIQEYGSLNQIKLLKFKACDQLQFNVISGSFINLISIQNLQINFVNEWYLEILSEYTTSRYWYYDFDRIDRVEDEQSNFAQEFKHLIYLTHLEINFENMIFSQVLGDFAKVIQNYKQLQYLSLKIPPLFTFMDQTTSARILKGLSGLDNLKEYRINFGNISRKDSEFIKTMAESIMNQKNLEILDIQLNAEITEDVAHKFVEAICNLKKLTSLEFFAQNIQTKKSLSSIFKPIYYHETLQNISLNIKQKDCFNLIQNMSVLPQIQNIHILFSNQKKLDVQNTLFNVSLVQKLVGLHIEFSDNLKLQPTTLSQLGRSLAQLNQIKDLELKFDSQNQILTKEMSFLLDSLSVFSELQRFSFYIGKGNIMNNLSKVKIDLGQLDSIKDCAYSFDQNIAQFSSSKIFQIKANLILNNETAFKTAEVVKYLKSIQIAKFKSVFQSYYELKLFLEKGVKYMINLRHFEMVNNIKVDQTRIKKQKSNIIRKAIRLINLNFT